MKFDRCSDDHLIIASGPTPFATTQEQPTMKATTKARIYATTAVIGITGAITAMGAPWKFGLMSAAPWASN